MKIRLFSLPIFALVALSVLTSPVMADEGAGRMLVRQAQQALAEGDPDTAIALIEQARIEWPGAPVIAHTLADARYRQGDYAGAILEYDKGMAGRLAFRAFFNKGVALYALAERDLESAGVPLDPAGLPADVDPGPMIEAIDEGLKTLEYCRSQFLDALVDQEETLNSESAAARESIAAINQRMDDLREMKEELEKRQEDQEQQDNEEGEDDQKSDEEESEDGEEQQDQQQDGENQEQDSGENESEQQQGEGEQPEEPSEPQQTESVPGQQTQLTPQEMVKLLEQLEELEDRARALQRIRRAQQRTEVERDW